VISVAELAKAFGATRAARDISFTAEDGRVTGLLGPNGAGKTTTLRCIAGLLRPDKGRVRLGTLDPARDPSVRRALGFLPERAGLSPRHSVWENLMYAGELAGLAAPERRSLARALLERLQLEALAERPAATLSQGECRRVAIARALLHAPQNLVLDEPGNGLDIRALQCLRELVRELAREGRAVLLSTHVMQDAERLCDQVVVLSQGSVVAAAAPVELQRRTGSSHLEGAVLALIADGTGLR
jgi:sodium transport system ATP-binding protein